ncbi:hypothetical protein EPN29_08090 [bacterium]|nr:MAG: hypothetical protein EPN29_08090 [bacterium]
MTSGGVLKETVVACAVCAAAVAVIAAVTGRLSLGMGVAAGLLLGSLNGYLIRALLDRRAPLVAGSLLRLLAFSAIVVGAALLLGRAAWTLPLGIGVAQLVMVAAGLRRGLRGLRA